MKKEQIIEQFTKLSEHYAKEETRFAADWCTQAADTLTQRGKDYDTKEAEPSGGERSMRKTVYAFNIITGYGLLESDGWLLLQLLKDVRQWTKPEFHEDSALDCVAYAALKAEALEGEHNAGIQKISRNDLD